MIMQIFLFVSVDLFDFVEVTKDVREGVSSSYRLFKKIGAIVNKNFVIRTNAFATYKLTIENSCLICLGWKQLYERNSCVSVDFVEMWLPSRSMVTS